jgi:hypothetical protein
MDIKKTKLISAILFSICLAAITRGQSQTYIAHYIEKSHIKKDTLIDNKTGIKFILDKNRIYITAINKNGKQLWKTDPAIDNKLEEYRVKRPIIVYFVFGDSRTGKNALINISYNNSQSGYIDKKTGQFHFAGQD